MDVENLFQSVRLSEIETYKKNVSDIDINIINRDGQSLLHEAVVSDNQIVAKDLISRGIDANIQDKNGQTPLHYAALHGKYEIATMIIDAGGDVNIKDVYGNNALWTATFNARGKYDIVKLYKSASGDVVHKNNHGRSALDFARQINDEQLVKILENKS